MNTKNDMHDPRVDRYVNGQMTEQEAAEFETYFLDQPEIIEQIELTQALKLGLLQAKLDAAESASSQQPSSGGQESWWQRFFSVHGSTGWVTAFASLALVVVAQSFYFTRQIDQLSAPQANTPVLVLSQTRGNAPAGVIFLNDNIRWFALELELDWPQADWYSLTVSDDESGKTITQVEKLSVSSNDTVIVSLPADSFSQGEYDLAVKGDQGEVAHFRMKVMRRKAH
jgi:hypothetical protein